MGNAQLLKSLEPQEEEQKQPFGQYLVQMLLLEVLDGCQYLRDPTSVVPTELYLSLQIFISSIVNADCAVCMLMTYTLVHA